MKRAWLSASRPKTLPAAIAPVIVGTALAASEGYFKLLTALAVLAAALLLQIGVNLANDYFDCIKGIDTDERLGPARAAANGLIPLKEMKIGIIVILLLAALDGIYLTIIGGLPILIIGTVSIIALLAYSGGPYPLASLGLGDLFVFIFFGIIAVTGSYYLQRLSVNYTVLLSSLPAAGLTTAIMVVNNYRDIETDKKSRKITLAVRLGKKGTKIEYLLLLILSYSIPFIFYFYLRMNFLILLPLLSIPLSILLLKQVWGGFTGKQLNKTLAGTAGLTLIYNLLFAAGILLNG